MEFLAGYIGTIIIILLSLLLLVDFGILVNIRRMKTLSEEAHIHLTTKVSKL